MAMERIDIRQTIRNVMPYKELLTLNEIVELVKDKHRLAPDNWIQNLEFNVRYHLEELVSEGLLEAKTHSKSSKQVYYDQFKYYGK